MRVARRTLLLAALAPVARAAEPGAIPATVVCPLPAPPPVLIPGVSDAFATRLVGGKIYRGLMRWDGGGVLQPDLAETVELSPDRLTYVFHLREGVTWHDSGGFGAEDVVFSLSRFHRALQPLLRLDRVVAVAPDPRTVVLSLPAPDGGFLASLDALLLPIVPAHIHDRPGWGLDPRQVTPVGTGPFRMDGWLRLVRFEWYAGPKPALAAIDFPFVPGTAARLALVESDAASLLAGDAVDLAAVPRLRTVAGLAVDADAPPAARTIAGLRLNPVVAPLNQPQVRVALAAAISRQAALREGWAGLGRVATGPLIAGAGRSDGAALPDYAPRAASTLLNTAGIRPDDTGIRARLRYLHPAEPPWGTLAPLLRASLAQIGIDLVAEPVTAAEWARRVAAGDYEVTSFSLPQTGDSATDLRPYAGMLPDLAPLLAGGAGGEALLVAAMPVLWLVEPAIPVVRARRLRLPGGVLADFAAASLQAGTG